MKISLSESFFVGFRPATLFKEDSGTSVFQWVLWKFSENHFCGPPAAPASEYTDEEINGGGVSMTWPSSR